MLVLLRRSFFGLFFVLLLCSCSKDSGVSLATRSCPSGFISVPGNASLGVSSFCVMQFEAKNISNVAVSQASGDPWVSVSQTAAVAACQGLGADYDLISNPQWLTIAQNAENIASNWSGGVVGSGMIPRGHTDNSPASTLEVGDASDPYTGTGDNSGQAAGSGWEQKRTLTLSNGNNIWDLAGNVYEWIDWAMAPGLQLGPSGCVAAFTELPSVACGGLAAADYLPSNTSYTAAQGIGRLYGGNGGAAVRGGSFLVDADGGAFTLFLNVASVYTSSRLGFRCVYSL